MNRMGLIMVKRRNRVNIKGKNIIQGVKSTKYDVMFTFFPSQAYVLEFFVQIVLFSGLISIK